MHPSLMDLVPWVRQGFCCSQLLMLLALRERGQSNPNLVRAMHGLCHGLGQAGGPCGLLTGGAAVIGLLAGKGTEAEEAAPCLIPLLNDYVQWFTGQTDGGQSCPEVSRALAGQAGREVPPRPLPGEPDALPPDPVLCGPLLAACWERILLLSLDYDLEHP